MISQTFVATVSNDTVDLLEARPALKYIRRNQPTSRMRFYAVQSAANITVNVQRGTSTPIQNSSPSVLAAAPSIDTQKDFLGEFLVQGGDVISMMATEPGTASTTIRVMVLIG